MKISEAFRAWLLHSEHPDPFGERRQQREALVKRLEQMDEAELRKNVEQAKFELKGQ